MKKGFYIAISLVFMGFTACKQDPSFKVEGEISGAAGKQLHLEQMGLEGIVSLDSVKIKEDGRFCFEASRPESPEFYRLRVDRKFINFSVDSTENLVIHADYDRFSTDYQIEGSDNSLKIKELVLLQADLQQNVARFATSGMPIGIVQDSVASCVDAYKKKVSTQYIFAEPYKSYAYFALFQELNGYMIFDPLSNKDDIKCFAAVATSLNRLYPHADRSRNLYNMVIKGMKNTREVKVEPLEIPEDKIHEVSIIDIPLNDLKGVTHHLTDLKGKVVLIDFTVYGDAASGARNLLLRELYDKYASQGLEIYQISLDADEHFWKTASDNLPWICVRDPQGVYSSYVKIYGVEHLPTSFLVNRDNELSLRVGEKTDLEAEIKKLL